MEKLQASGDHVNASLIVSASLQFVCACVCLCTRVYVCVIVYVHRLTIDNTELMWEGTTVGNNFLNKTLKVAVFT